MEKDGNTCLSKVRAFASMAYMKKEKKGTLDSLRAARAMPTWAQCGLRTCASANAAILKAGPSKE